MKGSCKSLNIVYATDDGYLIPTYVAAASALAWASNRKALRIHVLDMGINVTRWDAMSQLLRVRFGEDFGLDRHVVDQARLRDFKPWHGSYGTYARLLLPEMLPKVPWCVYCDGDTLFTDDPLKLADMFDAKCAIQGHVDWDVSGGQGMAQQKWFESKGLGWDAAQYVCAGFLLMNLEWFRANDGQRRCFEFIHLHQDLNFPDQDALCYVCRGAVGILYDRWGRFSWDAFREGRPGCLHYASDLPWKLMRNKYLDYNDAHRLWFEYAERLLGLKMKDALIGGFKRGVWYRKVVWRLVFELLAFLTRYVPGLKDNVIGDYCCRHYATRGMWREVLSMMGERR